MPCDVYKTKRRGRARLAVTSDKLPAAPVKQLASLLETVACSIEAKRRCRSNALLKSINAYNEGK